MKMDKRDPRRRMTWVREFRWVLASVLLGWGFELMAAEATDETLVAFAKFIEVARPDEKYDTEPMRYARR